MSVLTDIEIRNLMRLGSLNIENFEEGGLQPSSYDFRLGNSFKVIDETELTRNGKYISSSRPILYKEVFPVNNKIVIRPKSFMLGTTIESFFIDKGLSGIVSGRSSVGRMGLFIENAGWVDSGFKGEITLELYNCNNVPLELTVGERIGQFIFLRNTGECQEEYNGKYQGQRGATESMKYKDVTE